MPRTTNTGTKIDPKQQAQVTTEAPASDAATAAPEPAQETNPASLFDETQPEPPAAELQTSEPTAPSEPSVVDSPEGIDAAQEATPPAAPEPAVQPDSVPSSVAPTEVRLGQALCLLHRMPLGDVLAYAEPFAEKIEAMKYSAKVQALQPRMRATEGRCAPVYFTMNDDFEPEHLIAGDDALSAAKSIGLETVSVVLLYPDDAGTVQAYLNGEASTGAKSTEEDELVWRAMGYNTDS